MVKYPIFEKLWDACEIFSKIFEKNIVNGYIYPVQAVIWGEIDAGRRKKFVDGTGV